jgi:hypothetical protein
MFFQQRPSNLSSSPWFVHPQDAQKCPYCLLPKAVHQTILVDDSGSSTELTISVAESVILISLLSRHADSQSTLFPSLSISQDTQHIVLLPSPHCPLSKCTKQTLNLPLHRQTRPAIAYLLQAGTNVAKFPSQPLSTRMGFTYVMSSAPSSTTIALSFSRFGHFLAKWLPSHIK